MATAAAKTKTKKNLVIVESPSKAKTIGKFLGSRYKVVASVGHVRDLPKSKLGVDVEDDFEPQYINIRGKGDVIKELKKEAKNASKVFLATDPDREGEAISWHLAYLLGIDPENKCRIVFNEITKDAIKSAVKNPRPIDMRLVDAQQARRVLDRLVGYKISPLLWRKIQRGLSAGRVQTAALKIICDRENEIKNFVPEEYWTITAEFIKDKPFMAKLAQIDGKKADIKDKESADTVLAELRQGRFIVDSVEEKETPRKPYPPFTTSSMQQDAGNKLNFGTRKTMMIAQQLYEGIDIKGQGTRGLITYIRTDSVRVSEEARNSAAAYIKNTFGDRYWGGITYQNKKKNAQDAHEAIRPSYIDLDPESIKADLTNDQYKLYKLIWSRFVASQMAPAVYDRMAVGIVNGRCMFRANGSKQKFDGFFRVYNPDKREENILPQLEKSENLKLKDLKGEQNFTKPLPRFTESSLVRELEDKGIGRPSTYAPIVGTLRERKYIKVEKKSLLPTDLGFTVTQMMEEYFKDIVDVNFTAGMEDRLDDVEIKDVEWKQIIREFYSGFEKELEYADANIEKVEIEDEPTDEICDKCGRNMVIKHGRFGKFLACSGYPECKNTKPIVKATGVMCPKCGKEIVERRSRKGRIFYGCSGYPSCDQTYWDLPVGRKCPDCGEMLVEKNSRSGKLIRCSNKECGYKEKINNGGEN